MKHAISYIRCSLGTERQKNSLSVQRDLISQFAERNNYTLLREFSDEESGTSINRDGLTAALNYADKHACKIIIYRVDRLSRTPEIWTLISNTLDVLRFVELGSDIEPDFFTTSILIACSSNESRILSLRVSSAMQHLIKQGRKFGNPRIKTTCIPAGLKVRKQNAADFNDKLKGLANDLDKSGYKTLDSKVSRLNELGFQTRRGCDWTQANLYRVLSY